MRRAFRKSNQFLFGENLQSRMRLRNALIQIFYSIIVDFHLFQIIHRIRLFSIHCSNSIWKCIFFLFTKRYFPRNNDLMKILVDCREFTSAEHKTLPVCYRRRFGSQCRDQLTIRRAFAARRGICVRMYSAKGTPVQRIALNVGDG